MPATAQEPVARWQLDEGAGLLARDSGGRHLDGTLATSGPSWIAGVEGAGVRFDGDDAVALPDDPALEPQRITVAAWVRRDGSPGQFRYVFSKGSSSCLRSAYGLYTAEHGGAAFYVAGDGLFTLSPAVAPARIWDGRWHRVVGSYDGARVRLYLDGVQVGAGTPGPTHVEYGTKSRAAYIGTYRGDCELPFAGDMDDVGVWGAAFTGAQARSDASPPPETPATGPIGPAPGGGGSPGGLKIADGGQTTPAGCTSLMLNRRSVRVARRARIVVTVRKGSRRVRGARVLLRAKKLHRHARTGRGGRARFHVRVKRRHGKLKVKVLTARRASCGRPVAYIRVRRPDARRR